MASKEPDTTKYQRYVYTSSLIHVPPAELPIDRQEVLRYLGYKPGRSKLRSRILHLLEQEEERARALINPRGMYCILEAGPYRGQKIFRDAELVAFGIATAGEKLEKQVQEFFRQGEGTRGVLLDAIGSVAAEAITDEVNKHLDRWAAAQGYKTTRRFSPGYGPWDVRGQELVFKSLGRFTAGVRLSSSRLMSPLKSVSFACKLGRGVLEEINEGRCTACNMRDRCSYRRQGDACGKASGD